MTDPSLVSVVILNWNGLRFLSDCLESIYAQSYPALEIIIVDNGSSDGSLAFLAEHHPEVPLIVNRENLGFAQGMNVGIKASRGAFVLLLNEDTYLDPCFISNGMREFREDGRLGWVGGEVYALLDGVRSDRKISGAYALRRRFQLQALLALETRQEVLMVNNCAMFLRRAALDDVRDGGGWLDSGYFAYWEDTDLALRLALRQWVCRFTPEMLLWHVVSGSMEGKSRLIDKPVRFQVMSLANRYRTLIKDVPLAMLLELLPFLVLTEFLIVGYFLVLAPKTLRCNFRAIFDTVKSLPALLAQRARIQNRRTLPYGKFRGFFLGL